MPGLMRWVKDETYSIIPSLLFFGILFNLLHFSAVLMMSSGRITYTSYFGATIGAILAAKTIIIVRNLPYINLFPEKPLIYNISWKFFIYGIFVLLVQMLDIWLRGLHQTKSTTLASHLLLRNLTHPHFWGVQIWVYLLFLVYITLSELGRVLGRRYLRTLFFGF